MTYSAHHLQRVDGTPLPGDERNGHPVARRGAEPSQDAER